MDITVSEQRELSDYIARKLGQAACAIPQKECASIVWDAIEDYTGGDPTPDPEDMGRADDFRDHFFTRDQ